MLTTHTLLRRIVFCLFFINPVFAFAQNSPAPEPHEARTLDGLPLQGKILETMNSNGYTYLLLDATQGKIWVAIPENQVTVGQDARIKAGMTMHNFTSKTLNRTFLSIVFSPGLEQEAAPAQHNNTASNFDAALQAEQKGVGVITDIDGPTTATERSGGSAAARVAPAQVQLEKASGQNSVSVAECFAQSKELHEKTVRVRGKVMKVSTMIMGKNWIHLQDGTGDPAKKQHDLVVTTLADVEDGAVITAEGTLHAQRDFGAGYSYEVIVEDSKIER